LVRMADQLAWHRGSPPRGSAMDRARPPSATATIMSSPRPAPGHAAGLTGGQRAFAGYGRLPRTRPGGGKVTGAPEGGHTAIVTGANHGIGAAVAAELAGRGCAVLCTYLRVDDPAGPGLPPAYRENRARDGGGVADRIQAGGGRALAME